MGPASRNRGPASGRETHDRRGRLWLVAIAALAAPAILSPLVFLPMPDALPMRLYFAMRSMVRLAGTAPWWALGASAAGFAAHRSGALEGRRLLLALALIALAWLFGVTTLGRLSAIAGS